MARFGSYFIIAGALSGLLSLFDYELSLLIWVDTWGGGVAWLIRGAFILVGMALVSQDIKARQPQTQQSAPVQQSVNSDDLIR